MSALTTVCHNRNCNLHIFLNIFSNIFKAVEKNNGKKYGIFVTKFAWDKPVDKLSYKKTKITF